MAAEFRPRQNTSVAWNQPVAPDLQPLGQTLAKQILDFFLFLQKVWVPAKHAQGGGTHGSPRLAPDYTGGKTVPERGRA